MVKLFDVPPSCFQPVPKVTSTVLKLTPLPKSLIRHEPDFFKVLHAAFGQRRKTLANALSHGLKLEKNAVISALEKAGISPTTRAETVDLERFNRLTDLLFGDSLATKR